MAGSFTGPNLSDVGLNPDPWEKVREAQRAAIQRGEARLAEILSSVLEYRQGPLDREPRVPGTFVILPRLFYYDLERAIDELERIAKSRVDHTPKDTDAFSRHQISYREYRELHTALVRHGRNSGVY